MQDQPLHQRNRPQRHEHLNRANGFPQPVDAINAIVDDAEHDDQKRRQQQNGKRAFQMVFSVLRHSAKPKSKMLRIR